MLCLLALHHYRNRRRRLPRIVDAAPILLPLFCVVVCLSAPEVAPLRAFSGPAAPERMVHEVLRAHGLPIGLLPRGVTEFRIDGKGRFEVRLRRACSVLFESGVHYEANVTGTLSYGQIEAVSGISAQELFLWFPVRGIRVDFPSSGLIYLDVGVIYKCLALPLRDPARVCRRPPGPPRRRRRRPAKCRQQEEEGFKANVQTAGEGRDRWNTLERNVYACSTGDP